MELVFETAAGIVQARARLKHGGERTRVDSVTITNVPSFVYMPGLHGHARLPRAARRYRLRRRVLCHRRHGSGRHSADRRPRAGAATPGHGSRHGPSNRSIPVAHPALPLTGVAGVVFTGPPQDPESHLRAVTVTGAGVVNWSPGATAMSGRDERARRDAVAAGGRHSCRKGWSVRVFRGRGVARTIVGELPALVTEIEGTAWITGEHTLSPRRRRSIQGRRGAAQ